MLFSRPDNELRELLDAMQSSTHIRDIDRIRAGETLPPDRVGQNLEQRIDRAAALVRKLTRKGKQETARELLREFRARPVPLLLLFRAEAPTAATQAAAQEAAAAELADAPPDPGQAEKDRHWRLVGDEIARRGGVSL